MPGRRPSRAPSGRGRRPRRRLYGRAGACTRLRFAMTRRRRGYKDAGSLTAEEGAAGRAHAAPYAAREVLEVVGPREADQAAVGARRVLVRVLVQWCCLARRLGRVWHRFPRCSVGRHRLRCVWRRVIAVAAGQRRTCTARRPRCNHTVRFALIRAFGACPLLQPTRGPFTLDNDFKSFSPAFALRIRRAPPEAPIQAEAALL